MTKFYLLSLLLLHSIFLYSQQITEKWSSYTSSTTNVQTITQEGTTLWIGSNSGVFRLNKDTKVYSSVESGSPKNILSSCVDINGNKWFGTEKDGIYLYTKAGVWQQYTSSTTVPGKATKLISDSKGRLWAILEGTLVKIDLAKNTFFDVTAIGLCSGLTIDKNDNIYVVKIGAKQGLYKIDTNESITSLGNPSGYSYYTDLYMDSFNNVWGQLKSSPAGNSGAVCKYKAGSGWDIYSFSNIGFYKLEKVSFDSKNSNYFIGDGKLFLYDGQKFAEIALPNAVTASGGSEGLLSIYVDTNDVLWLGSIRDGLFKLNSTTWERIQNGTGMFTNRIAEIAFDKLGNKWFATDIGLMKYDGTTWSMFNTTNSSIPVNYISSVATDSQNNIWIATYDYSVVRYDGTKWETFSYKDYPEISLSQTYPSTKVFVDKDDNLWIGDGQATLIRRDKNNKWIQYTKYNGDIPSGIIDFGQKNGNLWMSTLFGIVKYDGTSLSTYRLRNLSNLFVSKLDVDNDGAAWCIGAEGIEKFTPSASILYQSNAQNFNALSSVHDLGIDRLSIKWIGTSKGLLSLDGSVYKQYSTTNSAILSNEVQKVYIENKSNGHVIWLVTDVGLSTLSRTYTGVDKIEVSGRSGVAINEGGLGIITLSTTYASSGKWEFYDGSQWKAISEAPFFKVTENSGTNFYQIYLQGVKREAHLLKVRCLLSNLFNEAISPEITVAVNPLNIILQPQSKQIFENADVTFVIGVQNGYTYKWEYNDGKAWFPVTSTSFFKLKSQDNLGSELSLTNVQKTATNFKFRCTSSNGNIEIVSDEVTLTVAQILATETEITKLITFSPNPSSDYIRVNSTLQYAKIQLVNQAGQLVKECTGTEITVSDLVSQPYFIQLVNKNGEIIARDKVMVLH